jgi:hypothetical protein
MPIAVPVPPAIMVAMGPANMPAAIPVIAVNLRDHQSGLICGRARVGRDRQSGSGLSNAQTDGDERADQKLFHRILLHLERGSLKLRRGIALSRASETTHGARIRPDPPVSRNATGWRRRPAGNTPVMFWPTA